MPRLLGLLSILLIAMLSASVIDAGENASFDLQAAIDDAAPGAVIEAPPGLYFGSFSVDKPIHLIGQTGTNGERAVLDGGGTGTVLTIRAAQTVVENFVIRGSGSGIDQEEGGIVVENAADVQLIGNQLEDVLYGVRGIEAHRLIVRDNQIRGKAGFDVGRRGDGIRLWQSVDSLVEGNQVEGTRDAVFWFSDGSTVRNNIFQHNRYGVHMMYTDHMTVVDNYLNHNSVGAYMMYSANVLVQGNTFRENRGPSGYGLALKDMDAVTTQDNYLIDNRVGIFFDNTPSRVDLSHQVERNVLAYNDIGVLMMPAVQRNFLRDNTFLDNLEQVAMTGGGSRAGDQLGANTWDGNFWSDYVGYDAEPMLDGVGDLPYRSESLFENLADRHPNLKLFHFSPVEEAIDLAAKAFPVIKPKPKLTDHAPRMNPILPAAPATIVQTSSHLGYLAAALIIGAVALFAGQIGQGVSDWRSRTGAPLTPAGQSNLPHLQPLVTDHPSPIQPGGRYDHRYTPDQTLPSPGTTVVERCQRDCRRRCELPAGSRLGAGIVGSQRRRQDDTAQVSVGFTRL